MYKEMYDYYLKHQELWHTIASVLKEEYYIYSLDNVTVGSLKESALEKLDYDPDSVRHHCFCCECAGLYSNVVGHHLCLCDCIVEWVEDGGSCTSAFSPYGIFSDKFCEVRDLVRIMGQKDESKLDELVSLCHKIAELPFRYQKELEEELKGENEDARSRTE